MDNIFVYVKLRLILKIGMTAVCNIGKLHHKNKYMNIQLQNTNQVQYKNVLLALLFLYVGTCMHDIINIYSKTI